MTTPTTSQIIAAAREAARREGGSEFPSGFETFANELERLAKEPEKTEPRLLTEAEIRELPKIPVGMSLVDNEGNNVAYIDKSADGRLRFFCPDSAKQLSLDPAYVIPEGLSLRLIPAPPEHGAIRDTSRDWLEDSSHENGNYQNKCVHCSQIFIGHKRRIECRKCSPPAPPEPEAGGEKECHCGNPMPKKGEICEYGKGCKERIEYDPPEPTNIFLGHVPGAVVTRRDGALGRLGHRVARSAMPNVVVFTDYTFRYDDDGIYHDSRPNPDLDITHIAAAEVKGEEKRMDSEEAQSVIGAMVYRGNTIRYIYDKLDNYSRQLGECGEEKRRLTRDLAEARALIATLQK